MRGVDASVVVLASGGRGRAGNVANYSSVSIPCGNTGNNESIDTEEEAREAKREETELEWQPYSE